MSGQSPARAPAPVYATHGEVRGLSQDRENKAATKLRSPEDPKFEGLFGRMFDKGASVGKEILGRLAEAMTAPPDRTPAEDEPDDDENTGTADDPGISAGYTYLGQFIDHDITFDPASSLQRKNDPNALVDYRTPQFDLDNLYGRGPADQPYLYEHDGKKFVLGDPLTGNENDKHAFDLPRSPSNGRAIIGDPRNDENEIVSQLLTAMLRFHNLMVKEHSKKGFEEIQQIVRCHYQWIVLHDFLPTIVNKETLASVLPHGEKTSIPKHRPRLKFFNRSRWRHGVFMPVEFSVAAYRFGHAMIRHTYRLNTQTDRLPLLHLFGFQRPREGRAIDWSLFFRGAKDRPLNGPKRLQWAYKIDTSLVHPLGDLPTRILSEQPPVAKRLHSLAWRDLIRGLEMSLPSGQAVAKHLYPSRDPVPDEDLKIGPATEAAAANNKSLVSISRAFKNKAPLWFYVLAEAQQEFRNNRTPIRLGPVGGRIVAEVIVGLMAADKTSVLHQKNFRPEIPVNGGFRMWDLLEFVRERSPH
jgi:hypothetical protein